MKIGSIVTLVYTGTLDDGTVFGYAKPENPLVFQTGMELVVDGFEKAILEMDGIGDARKFTLSEYDAYGEYVENRTVKVPLPQIPQGRAVVGKIAYFEDEETGAPSPAVCVGVSDDYAEYDLNHPLAGKKLTFEVEIVDIEEPSDDFVPLAERRSGIEQQYGSCGM